MVAIKSSSKRSAANYKVPLLIFIHRADYFYILLFCFVQFQVHSLNVFFLLHKNEMHVANGHRYPKILLPDTILKLVCTGTKCFKEILKINCSGFVKNKSGRILLPLLFFAQ